MGSLDSRPRRTAVGADADAVPRLVVTGPGAARGRVYALRAGQQLLGRDPDADITVAADGVSRRHAYVSWDGRTATVLDAGSTNGTTVNGEAVPRTDPGRTLRTGDVVRLGALELRVDIPLDEATQERPVPPPQPQWHTTFGPNHGIIGQSGRDLHFTKHEHHGQEDPLVELFLGRGVGRALMALGCLVALAGFGAWMYLIFAGGASVEDLGAGDPFEDEVLGVPVGMAAFGAFAAGAVLASLGGAMSRAARAREEHRHTVRGVR